jgi:ribonuclease HI
MLLRDAVVYARAKADGSLAIEPDGRVAVKYKLGDDQKTYRANAKNLTPAPGDPEIAQDPAPAAPTTSAASGDTIIIYTDGACTGNPGPMGLGAVVIDGGKRLEISEFLGEGTNNIAELTAVLRALEAVSDRASRPVRVHTDSQYAIGLLSKNWKAKANQELVERLRGLTKRFPGLRFEYVRGHSGIPENERCDELARQAIISRTSSRVGGV